MSPTREIVNIVNQLSLKVGYNPQKIKSLKSILEKTGNSDAAKVVEVYAQGRVPLDHLLTFRLEDYRAEKALSLYIKNEKMFLDQILITMEWVRGDAAVLDNEAFGKWLITLTRKVEKVAKENPRSPATWAALGALVKYALSHSRVARSRYAAGEDSSDQRTFLQNTRKLAQELLAST